MVIDTSALVAILLREQERLQFLEKMSRARRRLLSAVSLTETAAVLMNRPGAAAIESGLDEFFERGAITVVPVDRIQAAAAREAYRQFGKGRHPAHLNLGDCFPYALAKITGEPLLFKGNDFSQTDVLKA